jgi:hypothetical protein
MRRFLARSLLLLSVLIAAAYLFTGWWTLYWSKNVSQSQMFIRVVSGSMHVHGFGERYNYLTDWPGDMPGFYITRRAEFIDGPFQWLPGTWSNRVGGVLSLGVVIPLWLPFLATAIPAILLSRRRLRQNHCARCNYDRSATPNLPCPECGTSSVPSA